MISCWQLIILIPSWKLLRVLFGLSSEYGSLFYRKFRWHLSFQSCSFLFQFHCFSASSCNTAVNLSPIVPLFYLLSFISFFMSRVSYHIQAFCCTLFKVDASKTSTLEAGAKPEPAPAPKPEEKKAEKKPSPFANLLKPKVNTLGVRCKTLELIKHVVWVIACSKNDLYEFEVLLGQVSSKIHSAASSAAASISLGAGGAVNSQYLVAIFVC